MMTSTLSSPVTLSLKPSSPGRLTVDPETVTIAPGQEVTIVIRLHVLQVR